MNITNPVYTSMSDISYHCELTETGVWVCQNFNESEFIFFAVIIGFCVGLIILIVIILIVSTLIYRMINDV